jgi:hypothetical protein
MGERRKPRRSGSASIRAMRGAEVLLAEVLVLKGMGVGNVDTTLRFEVMELMCGVWITTDEGCEPELWGRDWEDGEERVGAR